jgi:DUF1365 family protein
MESCLYAGWVRHRRLAPRPHAFRYRLCMLWLDLDEIERVFAGRWLWSARRPNLAWWRRADHLGDAATSLAGAVRDEVARQSGGRPRGPVRLLTHPRYFGFGFNPISLFYCYAEDGVTLEAVLAEVTNTPWRSATPTCCPWSATWARRRSRPSAVPRPCTCRPSCPWSWNTPGA